VASDEQIVHMMVAARTLSKGAAHAVSDVMSDRAYQKPWSTAAETFCESIPALLTFQMLPNPNHPTSPILLRQDERFAALVDGMREYRTILEVQKKAFLLLLGYISFAREHPFTDFREKHEQALRSEAKKYRLRTQAPRVLQTIESAMRCHSLDVDLQRLGCRLIEVLLPPCVTEIAGPAPGSDVPFVFPVNDPGLHLLRTVMAAMNLAPEDDELQKNACYAMAVLCSVKDIELVSATSTVNSRRRAMASVAGVPTVQKVIQLMISNAADEDYVVKVCQIVSFLLSEVGYDAALKELDGVFMEAMHTHVQSADVHKYACRALASFAAVHTHISQFRGAAQCAQFVVNLVQMKPHINSYCPAIAVMEAVLAKKNQSRALGTFTPETLDHFTQWQRFFVDGGAILLLLMAMDDISRQGRHCPMSVQARIEHYETIEHELLLVLHTLFVLIDDNVHARMQFLDASGPEMLMCVLSDFHLFKAARNLEHKTRGTTKHTCEGMVWAIFSLIVDEKNCSQHEVDRVRAVGTFLYSGEALKDTPHLDLRAAANEDKQGLLSPIRLAVICMAHTKYPSTIFSCISYLCKTCTNALACKHVNEGAVQCIMVAMNLYLVPPGFSVHDQHKIQMGCIALLERVSKHVLLRTDTGLQDLVFKPVLPALRQSVQYMAALARLQRTLANQQVRDAAVASCVAITHTAAVSDVDRSTAQAYLQHQENRAYDMKTREVRRPFLAT